MPPPSSLRPPFVSVVSCAIAVEVDDQVWRLYVMAWASCELNGLWPTGASSSSPICTPSHRIRNLKLHRRFQHLSSSSTSWAGSSIVAMRTGLQLGVLPTCCPVFSESFRIQFSQSLHAGAGPSTCPCSATGTRQYLVSASASWSGNYLCNK